MYHKSGAHAQIDEHGNYKVGSPETVQTWASKHVQQRADGSFDISAGDNLTIRVDGGKATIYASGDVNIVSKNDINMTASGKIAMNAGEGIDMRGVRIGLHAMEDNIDIYADQKIKIHSGADFSVDSGANYFLKTNGYHVTTTETKITASGNIDLRATNVNADDMVYLASGKSVAATASTDKAAVMDMPNPAPRDVAQGTRSNAGTVSGSNMADIDDYVDNGNDASINFNGEGFQKGVSIACQLQKQGYSKAAAAAAVGNMMHESAQFTADTEFGTGIGRGWLQWSFGRRDNFEAYAKANNLDPKSDSANFGFFNYEMEGHTGNHWTGGGSADEFKTLTDVDSATDYFMSKYERPDPSRAHLDRRQAYARAIYETECP